MPLHCKNTNNNSNRARKSDLSGGERSFARGNHRSHELSVPYTPQGWPSTQNGTHLQSEYVICMPHFKSKLNSIIRYISPKAPENSKRPGYQGEIGLI